VTTSFAFIHQLQHRSKANERMGLPERLRSFHPSSQRTRRRMGHGAWIGHEDSKGRTRDEAGPSVDVSVCG
jgi:hypothetical protein